MRKLTLSFLTIAVLFFGANIFVSNVLSQTTPFTLEHIRTAITKMNQASEGVKKTYYSKILNDVRRRGVDFSLTKENEELLRNEGATDEFIEVLRKNSQPLLKLTNDYLNSYEVAIAEGNSARDEREYAKAEAAYLRAQSLQIKDARAIYGLGNLYSDQQRWEEAESSYRTAIELEPTAAVSYIALSFVLTQPIVGKYTEAERIARQAIELDRNNPIAYVQLGTALELSGRIDQETRNSYERAIQLDQKYALAYAHLGRLLRSNGKAKESGEAYRRAIELATDAPTMILVADVLQSQQRYIESEQLLRQALREDQRNPMALLLLGRALTARAAFAEAETVLKKSIEIIPKSLISYALLSSLYVRRRAFDEAEKTLTRALQVVSENEKKRLAQEFETVGDGFLASGKKKDAIRVYQQAIALDKEKSSLMEQIDKAQRN